MKATFAITRNIKEVEKVFRQMVFNILTSNMDDHAKNFSFIYKNNEWNLSPAYDLVLSNGFNGQHTTTIAGQGNPTITDIFEAAGQAAIPDKKAKLIFDEVYSNTRNLLKYIPKSSDSHKF
jgi:serine/threonine-protein kinase HipA